MNRLVAFGCSNTYGQGLKDCHWEGKEKGMAKKCGPSQYAWPQLVADKLSMECHNASICGASNKLIMHQIISFPLLSTDTVVVMWSYPDRYCLLKNSTSDYRRWDDEPNYKHKIIAPWERNPRSKNYYRFVYDEDDHKIMTNHYISYTRLYLEKHNIPNLHTTCSPDINDPVVFDIQHRTLRDEYPKALDNGHPGHEAHQEIANRIYKGIST
jgi:hypothetical protein